MLIFGFRWQIKYRANARYGHLSAQPCCVIGLTTLKKKAFDDYIYIDVYLFEVFVYLHFKAIIYTVLVRDIKHTCTSNTHTLTCYLARFRD